MLLYEGKAKQVYSTDNENEYIVYYKDDATAFNGEKKAHSELMLSASAEKTADS